MLLRGLVTGEQPPIFLRGEPTFKLRGECVSGRGDLPSPLGVPSSLGGVPNSRGGDAIPSRDKPKLDLVWCGLVWVGSGLGWGGGEGS